ncbi:MAG: hypothetical protein J7L19_01835 [Dehalococcoidia bacterium]|nr:hypothetical protein [Dehalococcoidia bacterium]
MLISKRYSLSKTKMLQFLNEVEAVIDTASSLYIPPELSLPEVKNLLEKTSVSQHILSSLVECATSSKTGAVIFLGSSRKYLISPPFPIMEKYFTYGYDAEPLRCLLKHNLRIALTLVRLGTYAIGLYQGENLITSKVGSGLIHARHKKGGSSQQRFRRHRKKQIEVFLTHLCIHIREQFEAHSHTIDYIVYGGAWTTILSLRKQCSFLRQFDDRTLPPLLNIPNPRKTVLETAICQVWSSTVTEWHNAEDPN